jgi:nucleoid-associated protein YgaU
MNYPNAINARRVKLFIGSVLVAMATACATSPKQEAAAPMVPEPTPAPAPEPAPAPVAEPEPAPMPAPKVELIERYTVVHGDCLWAIASSQVIYGNPYQWPLIYKANTDQIKDADLIYPDQVLAIPRDMSASDVAAAIEHAKTRGAWSLGVVEKTDIAYLRVNGVVAQK